MSEKATLRLTLDITYDLNGETLNMMEWYLEKMVKHAMSEGLITGNSDAEVVAHEMTIDEVPWALDEDVIAAAIADRLENGTFALEDVPSRLARYGLMNPVAFVNEMRERMELNG